MPKEIILYAPPGRVGILLENCVSKSGTTISFVSSDSPLTGKAFEGDCITDVNGVDVHKMGTSALLEVFQRCSQEKKIITIVRPKTRNHEGFVSHETADKENLVSSEEHLRSGERHDLSSPKTATQSVSDNSRRSHHKKKSKKHETMSPVREVNIEVIHSCDDRPPLPSSVINSGRSKTSLTESKPHRTERQETIEPEIYPAGTDRPPLPPDSFDTSLSKLLHCNSARDGMIPGQHDVSTSNHPPRPVFVFDDSLPQGYLTKSKKYISQDVTSVAEQRLPNIASILEAPQGSETTCRGIGANSPPPPGQLMPHITGHDESNQYSSDAAQNEVISSSTEPRIRSTSHHLSFSHISSVDDDNDIEQGLSNDDPTIDNAEEIIADAVLVHDEDVFDAVLVNDNHGSSDRNSNVPQIVFNQTYTSPENQLRTKRQGWWENKYFVTALALVGLFAIASSIIAGIIVGVKNREPTEVITNIHDESSINASVSVVDSHNQQSNLMYNSTTNNYYYPNGTLADNVALIKPTSTAGTYLISTDLSNLASIAAAITTSTSDETTTSASSSVHSTTSTVTTSTAPPTIQVIVTSVSNPILETISSANENFNPFAVTTIAAESSTANNPAASHVNGNDKCEDAGVIKDTPAVYSGSTSLVTPEFTSTLEALCGTSLDSKGVWYSFESDRRRIVRLEYELRVIGVGDSVLSIFTGACNNGSLTCVTNVFGAADYYGNNNNVAVYEFLPNQGDSYFFLLSGVNGDTAGEYEFRVTEYETPVNDQCEGAVSIMVNPNSPNITTGNLKGASPDFNVSNVGQYSCVMDWNTRGIWYQLVGRGTVVRIEYYLYLIGLGNSELSIFTGSCSDLICDQNVVGLADTWSSVNNAAAVYEFLARQGETYSFLLYGQYFDTVGEFEFKVSEYESPVNDKCAGSTNIEVSPTGPFVQKGLSTLGATPDFEDSETDTCGVDWYTRGLWYGFIGHGAAMKLEYQLYSVGLGNSEMSVFTGTCESLSCYERYEGVVDSWGQDVNALVISDFITEKGQMYFVQLAGDNFNVAGEYDFTVTEYDIPTNDNCEGASPISPESLILGTTIGAAPDFNLFDQICGGTDSNRGVWYSFTGNGSLTTISYTTLYTTQLSLFSGPCGNLICESDYGSATSINFLAVIGQSYRLLLSGVSFFDVGDFEVSMQQYDQPANDFCINAIEMNTFPFSHDGNLIGATPDFNNDTFLCGDVDYAGVWFSFKGTGKQFSLELQTVDVSSDFFGEIAVFQGQCGSFECISQKEESGGTAIVVDAIQTVADAQYKVLVATYMLPFVDVFFRFSATEGSQ